LSEGIHPARKVRMKVGGTAIAKPHPQTIGNQNFKGKLAVEGLKKIEGGKLSTLG